MADKQNEVFNIDQIVDDLIQNDLDPSVFDDLCEKERDIPKAPNFVEWCIGKQFASYVPFPRQIQFGIHLFEDYCPSCSDPRIINNLYDQSIPEILSRVQLLQFGKCPKCKKTRLDFYNERKFTFPNKFIAVCGQRSGKSEFDAGQASTYVLHMYLTLEDEKGRRIPPYKLYGIAVSTSIYMCYTAATVSQAEETLWSPFRAMFDNCPWFNRYHEFLNDYAERKGDKLLYDPLTYFYYSHKRISGFCEPPVYKTLRGKTRFLTSVDELGLFDSASESDRVRANADETCASLWNSLRTLRAASFKLRMRGRYDIPLAYSIDISSPFEQNDKIMRELRRADVDKSMCAFHYATWEVNPNITREDLQEDFKADYVKAMRDFGAIPPLAANQWFNNAKSLLRACRKELQNVASYTIKEKEDAFGQNSLYADIIEIHADKNTPRVLCIDTGFSNNAFALALLSPLEESNISLDLGIEVCPDEDKVINFPAMLNGAIMPLIDNLNVQLVLYDRWNSVDHIQRIRDKGIEAEQYSLTLKDFGVIWKLLSIIGISFPSSEINTNVLLPENSDLKHDIWDLAYGNPIFMLLLQILTVREAGRKLVKPSGGDDDLFRAFSLGASYLIDPVTRQQISKCELRKAIVQDTGRKITGPRTIGILRSMGPGGGQPGQGQSISKVGTFRPSKWR